MAIKPLEAEITSVDVDKLIELYRRQDELEREIYNLKKLYEEDSIKYDRTIEQIHERIDMLEKELAELRATLNELKASISLVQISVDSVEKHVSEINAKTDVTLNAQDKFITQLWRAFFVVLGVVTVAGGAIFALVK